MPHNPVLVKEVLEGLALRPGDVVLDGTLGDAGHALEILAVIGPTGKYIGLDQDPDAIRRCQEKLKDFPQAIIRKSNFENADEILQDLNIKEVDAVIIDIGVSSNQLEDPKRGFSFDLEGPLDMRMDPTRGKSAAQLVNTLSEEALATIFWKNAEERRSRRFAEAIVKQRPFKTTKQLVNAVEMALPANLRKAYKNPQGRRPPWATKHPATRVFQALRIEVNDELGVLSRGLEKLWGLLRYGGRITVISFHSLEDRIAKQFFTKLKRKNEAIWVHKRPLGPSQSESDKNPRSRSAKLRVIEKNLD